jgi:hypothetical protein
MRESRNWVVAMRSKLSRLKLTVAVGAKLSDTRTTAFLHEKTAEFIAARNAI